MQSIEYLLDRYDSGRMTRRQLLVKLGALMLAAEGASRLSAQTRSAPTFEAVGLNHIALRVSDVARSRDFYVKRLGMSVTRDGSSSAFLTCGKDFVALFRGANQGLDHYCYSIRDYEVGEAEAKLKAAGVQNVRRAGGRIYFDDPDGITVQLAGDENLL